MVALLFLLACGGPSEAPVSPVAAPASAAAPPVAEAPPVAPAPAATWRQVDADGLKAALDAGTVHLLVDVRTPEEFAAGHVPKAVNLPVGDLSARLAELAPHKAEEIYVICQSGGRSARASATLAAAGYTPVDVTGGTGSWKKKGYPIE